MSRYGRFSSSSRSYRDNDDRGSNWFQGAPARVTAAPDPETCKKALEEDALKAFGPDVKFRDVPAPAPAPAACSLNDEPEFDQDEQEPIESPSM